MCVLSKRPQLLVTTHNLTTTWAPSLGSQEKPSQVDGEHGSTSPFHESSISCPRFLSDSTSFNRFATSAVSKSAEKGTRHNDTTEAMNLEGSSSKSRQSRRKKSSLMCACKIRSPMQSTKYPSGTRCARADNQNLKTGFSHDGKKSTLSEAVGRRGGGEGQEQQRVEEEGAGGHTLGWWSLPPLPTGRQKAGSLEVGKGQQWGGWLARCFVASPLVCWRSARPSTATARSSFAAPALFRCVIDRCSPGYSEPVYARGGWALRYRLGQRQRDAQVGA
jgi:hypothetical protein